MPFVSQQAERKTPPLLINDVIEYAASSYKYNLLPPARELLLSHFGDKSVNALSIGPILHAMGQYKQKSTYTVSLSIQIERNKSFVPG